MPGTLAIQRRGWRFPTPKTVQNVPDISIPVNAAVFAWGDGWTWFRGEVWVDVIGAVASVLENPQNVYPILVLHEVAKYKYNRACLFGPVGMQIVSFLTCLAWLIHATAHAWDNGGKQIAVPNFFGALVQFISLWVRLESRGKDPVPAHNNAPASGLAGVVQRSNGSSSSS